MQRHLRHVEGDWQERRDKRYKTGETTEETKETAKVIPVESLVRVYFCS